MIKVDLTKEEVSNIEELVSELFDGVKDEEFSEAKRNSLKEELIEDALKTKKEEQEIKEEINDSVSNISDSKKNHPLIFRFLRRFCGLSPVETGKILCPKECTLKKCTFECSINFAYKNRKLHKTELFDLCLF